MAKPGTGATTPGRRRITPLDWFILAGGLVNLIVVVALVGYWLTH